MHIFRRFHHFSALSVPHKLGRPSCSYYRLEEIKRYEDDVAFNGTTFITNLMIIGHLVHKFEGKTHTHTPRCHGDLINLHCFLMKENKAENN
jgi:hypothetical protein